MFIKSSLRPKQQIQPKHYGTPLTGIVSSTIAINNTTLNVPCVCRSLRSLREQDTKLLDTLEDYLSKKEEILILGDFNAPVIDWKVRSCSAIGPFSDHLFEFVIVYLYISKAFYSECYRMLIKKMEAMVIHP